MKQLNLFVCMVMFMIGMPTTGQAQDEYGSLAKTIDLPQMKMRYEPTDVHYDATRGHAVTKVSITLNETYADSVLTANGGILSVPDLILYEGNPHTCWDSKYSEGEDVEMKEYEAGPEYFVKEVSFGAIFSNKDIAERTLLIDVPKDITITSISNAFTSYLKDIVFSETLQSINAHAFDMCNEICSITLRSPEPPTVTSMDGFSWSHDDVTYTGPVLYIPGNSAEAYIHTKWNQIRNICSIEDKQPINVARSMNGSIMMSDLYYQITDDDATMELVPTSTEHNGPWTMGLNAIETYSEYENNIVVPDEVTYDGKAYPVTGISTYAFYKAYRRYYSNTYNDLQANTLCAVTSLTLGKHMRSVPTSALASEQLKEVTVRATTPPAITTLTDCAINTKAVLYVPSGTAAAYRASDGWKDFEEIREYNLETGIRDVVLPAKNTNRTYDLQGRPVADGQKGIVIRNGRKVLVK